MSWAADDEVRAWYGGGYSEPPPPPPPDATTEGGALPPPTADWARPHFEFGGRAVKHHGDALVLGRFMPFHAGHARLLGRALQVVSGKVHVGIAAWPDDFIEATARAYAAADLLPRARSGRVLVARQVGRRGQPDGDSFWAPWVEWLAGQGELRGCKVLVSGEPKAQRFAELAGLEFELVDRDELKVSGAAVRRAPWKHWDELAPAMRPYFTSSVALVGPEGAGKSTLASALGRHFQTSVAHEYLADWLRGTGNTLPTREQMEGEVWNGQRLAWTQAQGGARRFFVADTDQLTIALWARRLFGSPIRAEPWRPGFTLLCDDAAPWTGPKERDEPEARKQMVIEFRRLLTGRGWPFAVLDGPREGRFAQAVEHVEKWVRSNPLER